MTALRSLSTANRTQVQNTAASRDFQSFPKNYPSPEQRVALLLLHAALLMYRGLPMSRRRLSFN